MIRIGIKKLILKLGGKCNLNCKHCHCQVPEFNFNPAIIDWIHSEPISQINFNGGEPLMYFDAIKYIIETLGDNYGYKFVTNGTLLTSKIIDFCNDHNVNIIVSFDGKESGRDQSFLPRWELLRFARQCSFSVYSSGSKNVISIQNDVSELIDKYKIRKVWNNGSIMAHFLHETHNSSVKLSVDDVREYLKSLSIQIEKQLIDYKKDGVVEGKQALVRSINKWFVPKSRKFGVSCCNSKVITLTLDGRFMVCPYRDLYCGDIESGIDIDYINSRIPAKCKNCEIFDICGNPCIENLTDHECMIAKAMNNHLNKLQNKYKVDFFEIVNAKSFLG